MATNQFGQTYEGNDDFRGWLAAGNRAPYMHGNAMGSIDPRVLLDYVGNDGRVNDQYANTPMADLAQYYYSYWQSGRQAPQQQAESGSWDSGGSSSGSSGGGGWSQPQQQSQQQSQYEAEQQRLLEEQRRYAEEQRQYAEEQKRLADEQRAREERERQQALNYWDSVLEQQRDELNGLNGALNEANAATDSQYRTQRNELQSQYNRNQQEYNDQSTRNKQNLQTNRNQISDRASQGLRGLLRILGAMGAGGSSVALYNAPEMVTQQANAERAGADQTFGDNQQKLDTNWGNYKLDFEDDQKRLDDWRTGQYKTNEKNVLAQRQSLLRSMQDAYGQKGSLDVDTSKELSSLNSQMRDIQSRMNQLNKFTAPTYTGSRATYQAPSLDSYHVGNSSISTSVSEGPHSSFRSGSSPTLAMLLGVKDRKDSDPYGRF